MRMAADCSATLDVQCMIEMISNRDHQDEQSRRALGPIAVAPWQTRDRKRDPTARAGRKITVRGTEDVLGLFLDLW